MCRRLFLLLCLVYCSSAKSFGSHHRFILDEDVATVESLRRDVREPAPVRVATEVQDMLNVKSEQTKPRNTEKNAAGKSDEGGYYKTYGSDAEGEKGYLKETYSKGDHGYKSLDTFHKQDGDKYGFEKHIVYGKAHDDKKSGYHAGGESLGKKNGDYVAAGIPVQVKLGETVDVNCQPDLLSAIHEFQMSVGTQVDSHHVDIGGYHDGDDAGDSHYRSSDDGDHHSEDYSIHHESDEPKSSSYGHRESYSRGNDDDGSYESYSSYSTSNASGDGKGEH